MVEGVAARAREERFACRRGAPGTALHHNNAPLILLVHRHEKTTADSPHPGVGESLDEQIAKRQSAEGASSSRCSIRLPVRAYPIAQPTRTNSTPSRERTQYCYIHPGHRAASARSAAEADMMAGRIRIPPLLSERDAKGSHKIVLCHRIRRHRDLVAGADDQVDRPGRRVVADREAAENEAGREQNLGEADVLPV